MQHPFFWQVQASFLISLFFSALFGFGYFSKVKITFETSADEFQVTMFFQVIKPFVGLTCYCTLLSLCIAHFIPHLTFLSLTHTLTISLSDVLCKYMMCLCVCVTFLPLSAASCRKWSWCRAGASNCREQGKVRCWVTNAPDITLSVLLPCPPPQNAQCLLSPPLPAYLPSTMSISTGPEQCSLCYLLVPVSVASF